VTRDDLPAYSDLILPAVKAVAELGGSAKSREIKAQVLSDLGATDEMLAVMQPTRPDASVLLERIAWGRSYAKLIGALESPSRGVFLLTPLGKELLNLGPEEAHQRTLELDREYRRNREKAPKPELAQDGAAEFALGPDDAPVDEVEEGDGPRGWQDVLLGRSNDRDLWMTSTAR
jgi:restriction system protein